MGSIHSRKEGGVVKSSHPTQHTTILLAIVASAIVLVVLAGQWLKPERLLREGMDIGFTYSVTYAEYLGLDPTRTFDTMVEELRPNFVRIPVYWSRIEASNNEYSFQELDRLMDIADEHDVPVTLAIGRKVPRWPECFLPEFALPLDAEALALAQLDMMQTTVERYKDHPALSHWQVENEPYFVLFGECPKPDFALLDREVALVRIADPNTPIQMTASGEQSLWLKQAALSDEVGVSVYRTIHSDLFGQITYPIPPWMYRLKERLVAPGRVFISELQMEPWFGRSVHTYTVQEQLKLFNERTFEERMIYAEAIGLERVSLWGAEWWYYLKEAGEPTLWDAAAALSDDTHEQDD
ncbi:hypothetical protein A3C17_04530 [Candidatus Uhrbacteria bacterium RIFCSPHIGHO2_02_FULL_53_13]|uniref:Uncharacterized protein n=2 Tax=Candidatus Uhriibacteriota TaxID=1752732 RepID=A0A1F7U172_9BACT|nr:MAG: hypothetical protein A3C17_04530 [Candidatus Uhrbacteria bacterium RIFCSPHIGHO2_02_FULL_53_13]OGL88865.1 MAG: hypothetical protein A3I45_01925 [Candidatus Uhrbacteria bacterium RIFCSPLOWO2_02_FULL_53_10]